MDFFRWVALRWYICSVLNVRTCVGCNGAGEIVSLDLPVNLLVSLKNYSGDISHSLASVVSVLLSNQTDIAAQPVCPVSSTRNSSIELASPPNTNPRKFLAVSHLSFSS